MKQMQISTHLDPGQITEVDSYLQKWQTHSLQWQSHCQITAVALTVGGGKWVWIPEASQEQPQAQAVQPIRPLPKTLPRPQHPRGYPLQQAPQVRSPALMPGQYGFQGVAFPPFNPTPRPRPLPSAWPVAMPQAGPQVNPAGALPTLQCVAAQIVNLCVTLSSIVLCPLYLH